MDYIRLPFVAKISRSGEFQPPTGDSLKFNVDGMSKGNPCETVNGGVLRNGENKVMGCFSKFVGWQCAFESEVLVMLNALQFCKEFSFRQVIIESDSSLAVAWVNNHKNSSWKLLS